MFKIRPEIFDFEPALGLNQGKTKPKISGTVPTNWTERGWILEANEKVYV